MRIVLPVLALLMLASCLESNPQPSPEKNGIEDFGGHYTGADVKSLDEIMAPAEDTFHGGGDAGAQDIAPVPADALQEVMFDALEDGTTDASQPDLDQLEGPDSPPDAADVPDVAQEIETPGEIDGEEVAPAGDSSYVAGGTFFGECGGACKMDITVQGDAVNFVARDWDGTVYVDNNAILTTEGLDLARTLAVNLVGVELQEVYGCPDCADGGGAYVTLRRDSVESTHTYEFGQPPEGLQACDQFTLLLRDAMAGCQSNDFVTVDADCTPLG